MSSVDGDRSRFLAGAQAVQYHADGFVGPSVSLSADVRRLAGFEPALVVDLVVPAERGPMCVDGSFAVIGRDGDQDLTPERSEAWVLRAGPRTPISIDPQIEFLPLSAEANTLYKLYFRLPLEQQWRLRVPRIRCGEWTFDLPVHALSRGDRNLIYVRAAPNET
jgi:hypothetical protein